MRMFCATWTVFLDIFVCTYVVGRPSGVVCTPTRVRSTDGDVLIRLSRPIDFVMTQSLTQRC